MLHAERRFVPGDCELRAGTAGGKVLGGYVAVFNRYSHKLGGFVEQVAPGAFAKTIQEADIRGLFNHSPMWVLGRNRANTLRLSEDNTGLAYEIDLPNTTQGRDMAEMVERGDVTGASFTFNLVGPDGDDWGWTDQEVPLRTLRQARLYDVGPATFPAYPDTEDDTVKAAIRTLAARCQRPLDELAAGDVAANIRAALLPQTGAPQASDGTPAAAQPQQPCTADDQAAARRRRLELLERRWSR